MNKEQLINDLNSLFDSFLESKGIDLETSKLTTNRFNAIMMFLYDSYVCKLEITNNRKQKQYSYIDFINLIEWYISKCLYLDLITLYGFCLLINRSMGFLNTLKYADNIELESSFIYDIDLCSVDSNTNNKCSINNNSVVSSNNINNNSSVNSNNNICNKDSSGIDNSSSVDNIYNGSSSIYNDSDIEAAAMDRENATLHIKSAIQKLYETLTQSTVNKLNDTTIGLVTNANNNKDVGLMYAKERIEAQAKARQTIALSDLPLLE